MERRVEEQVELFRAFTVEEVREHEAAHAIGGYFRGEDSSSNEPSV